uniref:Uncharacterized protein n=1 Tax=Daphnia galeata TaxID=27404 RepID=A0A8J2WQ00_9CRUS|nr:unnamed protein product [Daphnia galeata]
MKKLDVLQVLAERNERKKHELELNGMPSESNDSLSIAPNFSDEVNLSWLEKGLSIDDVPKMCPSDLVNYLRSEIKAKHFRRSSNTIKVTCRYLFFLMSVTTSKDLMEVCLRILKDKISDSAQPFCIEVPDLLLVLMNYGTVKKQALARDCGYFFSSCSPETEKIGMCHVMLNLSVANCIAGDTFLTLIIRDIISLLLESFTAEEWSEIDFKMVEELVYQCWINDLDATAAVQRITCIPTTTSRGVMFQQAASYFAIQHLMDLCE